MSGDDIGEGENNVIRKYLVDLHLFRIEWLCFEL